MAEHIEKRKDKSPTPEYRKGWERIWGEDADDKNRTVAPRRKRRKLSKSPAPKAAVE